MIAPSPGQFRTVVLEGSQTSYAQYRQWHGGGVNCSLELEFRTSQPDGLLLYTDNRDLREYMQLKLVNGGVNLRFNWGDGAHVLSGNDITLKLILIDLILYYKRQIYRIYKKSIHFLFHSWW